MEKPGDEPEDDFDKVDMTATLNNLNQLDFEAVGDQLKCLMGVGGKSLDILSKIHIKGVSHDMLFERHDTNAKQVSEIRKLLEKSLMPMSCKINKSIDKNIFYRISWLRI